MPLTFGRIFERKAGGNAVKDTHSFHKYVIYKYIYKGYALERETRRLLRRYDDFSQWIDAGLTSETVSVINGGRGQFSLMMALVHPEIQVHSYHEDNDDSALLSAMSPFPENLHVHCSEEIENTEGTLVFNLDEILN